jgi:hypothetical protein
MICDVNTLIETFTAGMIFGAVLMFFGAWVALITAFRRAR